MRLRMLRNQPPNCFDILRTEATALNNSRLVHALFLRCRAEGVQNKITSTQYQLNCYCA